MPGQGQLPEGPGRLPDLVEGVGGAEGEARRAVRERPEAPVGQGGAVEARAGQDAVFPLQGRGQIGAGPAGEVEGDRGHPAVVAGNFTRAHHMALGASRRKSFYKTIWAYSSLGAWISRTAWKYSRAMERPGRLGPEGRRHMVARGAGEEGRGGTGGVKRAFAPSATTRRSRAVALPLVGLTV